MATLFLAAHAHHPTRMSAWTTDQMVDSAVSMTDKLLVRLER